MRFFLILLPALALWGQDAVPPVPSQPRVPLHAALLRQVQADYTAEARAVGLQGTVSLYMEVNDDGEPEIIHVMQGLGLGLDEKAVEAAAQWKFQPNHTHEKGAQDIREALVEFRLQPAATWRVSGLAYTYAADNAQRQQGIIAPTPTHYVAPDAAACSSPGKIQLGMTIGEDGQPAEVRVIRGGVAAQVEALTQAVGGWRFQAATSSGKPLGAKAQVTLSCGPEPSSGPPRPVYRLAGGFTAPVALIKKDPTYSPAGLQDKRQGTSIIYVHITPEGEATDLQVVKSLGMSLDQKAMEAIKLWEFKPGTKGGNPVSVEATIEVNFRLR